MPRHLDRDVEKIKHALLTMAGTVEERLQRALNAFQTRDLNAARAVVVGDAEIDQMEIDIEEDCLKTLALYQPVGADLRFIIAVLKIDHELERIGDLTKNIAERAADLARLPAIAVPYDFATMARVAADMLRQSLDSLMQSDVAKARGVRALDEIVDTLHREAYDDVQRSIRANVNQLEPLIQVLSVSRNLERVADLATNIAEVVVYMIDGELVRHCSKKYRFDDDTSPSDAV